MKEMTKEELEELERFEKYLLLPPKKYPLKIIRNRPRNKRPKEKINLPAGYMSIAILQEKGKPIMERAAEIIGLEVKFKQHPTNHWFDGCFSVQFSAFDALVKKNTPMEEITAVNKEYTRIICKGE